MNSAGIHTTLPEGHDSPEEQKPDLKDQILTLLNQHGVPLTRSYIRSKVRVRNQRVCDTLKELEQEDLVMKTDSAYVPKNGALFQ